MYFLSINKSYFLFSDNGILYLLDNGQKIEILEDDLKKNTAFKDVHCLKHINIKDTCAKLENKYFWFGKI